MAEVPLITVRILWADGLVEYFQGEDFITTVNRAYEQRAWMYLNYRTHDITVHPRYSDIISARVVVNVTATYQHHDPTEN